MKRMKMVTMTAVVTLGIGATLTMSDLAALGKSKIDKAKLVGGWTLVSITNTLADGKTVQGFGPNDGIVVFEGNGTFVQALARSDLSKFASNNRNTGTADENKSVVQGSLTLFGTYKVTSDGTMTLHVERSTFPNWNGTDQSRTITSLTATELKWHNPAATVGGTTETVWKRTK
jgi:hypothetical protein